MTNDDKAQNTITHTHMTFCHTRFKTKVEAVCKRQAMPDVVLVRKLYGADSTKRGWGLRKLEVDVSDEPASARKAAIADEGKDYERFLQQVCSWVCVCVIVCVFVCVCNCSCVCVLLCVFLCMCVFVFVYVF